MLLALAIFGLTMSHSAGLPVHASVSASPASGFAFGSPTFNQFVSESYRVNGGDAHEFYRWFERAFRRTAGESRNDLLIATRRHIRSLHGSDRVVAEMQLAASLHSIVRRMLPVFSLERGYEFAEAERHGKRQCLLQSVLISSLLQQAGLRSGIVMIFRRQTGELCNNAHNVALLHLSDGTDVLVDGSSREPFAEHRGILVKTSRGYLYVDPLYSASRHGVITGYQEEASRRSMASDQIAVLDNAFITSQFDYYRAERTEHGVMDRVPLPLGVNRSIAFLRKSIQECPGNPLAEYVLGRAYRMNGDMEDARLQFRRARRLYSECGWIPESVRSARI